MTQIDLSDETLRCKMLLSRRIYILIFFNVLLLNICDLFRPEALKCETVCTVRLQTNSHFFLSLPSCNVQLNLIIKKNSFIYLFYYYF